jgi:hypothetical protein
MILTILIWVLPLLFAADHSVQSDVRGCVSYLDCKESEYCNRDGECMDLNEGYVEPEC